MNMSVYITCIDTNHEETSCGIDCIVSKLYRNEP